MDDQNQNTNSEKRSWWSMAIIAVLAGLIGFFVGQGTGSPIGGELALNDNNQAVDSLEASASLSNALNDKDKSMELNAKAQTPSVTANPLPVANSGEMMASGQDSISAKNQPAGQSVMVSGTLKGFGWIVVHELNSDDSLGRILGARRFASGAFSGAVELLKPTVAPGKYAVMIHADDGDTIFDTKKDLPLLVDQKPVMAQFSATAGSL